MLLLYSDFFFSFRKAAFILQVSESWTVSNTGIRNWVKQWCTCFIHMGILMSIHLSLLWVLFSVWFLVIYEITGQNGRLSAVAQPHVLQAPSSRQWLCGTQSPGYSCSRWLRSSPQLLSLCRFVLFSTLWTLLLLTLLIMTPIVSCQRSILLVPWEPGCQEARKGIL